LHGGLSRPERRQAIDEFTHGRARILMATDAAGEGLNFQSCCRVVINVELPWNPMRLEQRIGRVDRIGQKRSVHAFHLIAHESGERLVVEHLQARIARVHQDFELAPTLRVDVAAEHLRLVAARALAAQRGTPGCLPGHSVLVRIARQSSLRRRLGSIAIVVLRSQLVDASGRRVATRLTPVRIDLRPGTRIRKRAEVQRLLNAIEHVSPADHDVGFGAWSGVNQQVHNAFGRARVRRERAVLDDARDCRPAGLQQSLFDQRAAREQQSASLVHADVIASAEQRVDAIERCRTLTVVTSPALVLLP
jgi:hypothetical protein